MYRRPLADHADQPARASADGDGIPVRLRTGGARVEGAKPVVDHSTIPVETERSPDPDRLAAVVASPAPPSFWKISR